MSDLISVKMQEGVALEIFSGGELLVAHRHTIRFHKVFGFSQIVPTPIPLVMHSFFDLASLTKPLATGRAIQCLINEGIIKVDDPVSNFITEYKNGEKEKVTVADLLLHRSGLPAWKPYYEAIRNAASPGFLGSYAAKHAVYQMAQDEPLIAAPDTCRLYSDIGFILLGKIIEAVSQQPLDQFCTDQIFSKLKCEGPFFQPFGKERAGRFVATEQCPWRGEVVLGKVHDDNCYVMGGVAGHAGLFGTAHAVYELLLQTSLLLGETTLASPPGRTSAACSPPAQGWDTKSPENSSSGRFFSPESFGHLGFTGTSIWIDPVNDLVVVLLTNRVHPSRKNERIRQFRPEIHDIIFQEVIGASTAYST